MLTTIKDLLSSMFDSLTTVYSFFQNFIDKLVYFFKLVVSAVGFAADVIATLPDWIQVFAVAAVAVSVIYLIVGRNTN